MQETLEDPPSTVTFSKTSIRTCTQSDFDDTQSTLIYTARAWCTLPNTVDPGETIGMTVTWDALNQRNQIMVWPENKRITLMKYSNI